MTIADKALSLKVRDKRPWASFPLPAKRDPVNLAVVEALDVAFGNVGDGLDRFVSIRDLVAADFVSVTKSLDGRSQVVNNIVTYGEVESSTVPTGFEAIGTFNNVHLKWNLPTYKGHMHTQVWRYDADELANAVKIADVAGNVFADAVTAKRDYYYWIRHVNKRGRFGAYNSAAGTLVQTATDPAEVLAVLQDQIDKSAFVESLRTAVELIDKPSTGLVDQLAQVNQDKADLDALLGDLASFAQNQEADLVARLNALITQANNIEVDKNLIKSTLGSFVDGYANARVDLPTVVSQMQQALAQIEYNNQTAAQMQIEQAVKAKKLDTLIAKYQNEVEVFRDAVFNVDPESGSIEFDAVEAVRTEALTKITELKASLDSVKGDISFLATRATVDALTSTLNDVSLTLSSANAAIEGKASQLVVDDAVERLTTAEFNINANQQNLSLQINSLTTQANNNNSSLVALGLEMDALTETVALKASSQDVTNLQTNVVNVESRLDAAEGELTSKVERSEFEGAVAESFSETKAYIVGDEVLYAANIWRCIADVPAGSWTGTDNWVNEGSVSGRFARAEQRLKASEDNHAQLVTELSALNLAEATAALATVQDKVDALATDSQALVERDQSIKAEFKAAAETAIKQATKNANQDKQTEQVKVSVAAVEQGQQALADAVSAQAEQTVLIQAQFNQSLASVYERQAVFVNEQEAQAKQAKVFSVELANAKAILTETVNLTLDADSALMSKLSQFETGIGDVDTLVKQVIDLNLSPDSALLTRFSTMQTSIDDGLTEVNGRVDDVIQLNLAEDSALIERFNSIETDLTDGLTDVSGKIDAIERLTLAPDSALALRFVGLDAKVESEKLSREAAIDSLSKAVSDESSARAEAIETLTTQVADDKAALNTSINQAKQSVTDLEKTYGTVTTGLQSQIDDEKNTRASEINRVDQSIVDEASARATAVNNLKVSYEQADAALQQGITNTQLNINTTNATLNSIINLTADSQTAIMQKFANMQATIDALDGTEGEVNLSELVSLVAAEQTARGALDTRLTASITTETETRTTEIARVDQAIIDEASTRAEQFNTLTGQFNDNAAAIDDVLQLKIDGNSALAQQFNTLDSKFVPSAETAIANAVANANERKARLVSEAQIISQQKTLSEENKAQASSVEQLQASLVDVDKQMQIAFSAISEAKSVLVELDKARAALALSIEAKIAENNAGYDSIIETLATKSEAETKKQEAISAANSNAESLVNTLNQSITGEDGAIAQAIDQISATYNGQTASVEQIFAAAVLAQLAADDVEGLVDTLSDEHAQTVTQLNGALTDIAGHKGELDNLNTAYTSLWKVKSTVNEVTGAIGLLNDGNRVKAYVAADDFLVVNRIGESAVASALFAVVNNSQDPDVPDGVYLDDAYMNRAFIKQIIAEKITADYINAIELTAVNISGGSIDINEKFTVNSNGHAALRSFTVYNDAGDVIMSSNTAMEYSLLSGKPESLAAISLAEAGKLAGIAAGADVTDYGHSSISNDAISANQVKTAAGWDNLPASGATRNTGALANKDAVNLGTSEITGTLPESKAAAGLKNSNLTITSDGKLKNGTTTLGGQVTPLGIGVDATYIKNLLVQTIFADEAFVAQLTAGKVWSGSMFAYEITGGVTSARSYGDTAASVQGNRATWIDLISVNVDSFPKDRTMVVGEPYFVWEPVGNYDANLIGYFKLRYLVDNVVVKETPLMFRERNDVDSSTVVSFPSALLDIPTKTSGTTVRVQIYKYGDSLSNPFITLYEKIVCRLDMKSAALS